MAAPNRSFAGRIASINSMVSGIENWDDADFEDSDGLLFKASTVHSLSSRLSVRSESNTGDDDWQVLLAPDDDLATNKAIFSAKQAGIPIPTSVPASALMGGSIKRLGKPRSSKRVELDEDWGNDLELPDPARGELKLRAPMPHTPDDHDDFGDDWGEGSLGIRFAGTRRDPRGGRSSSASAMSPSMGSCMTLESEDDDLTGLLLPVEPMDFSARLARLKAAEQPPAPSPFAGHQHREPPPTSVPAAVPAEDVPVPAEESVHQEPPEDDFEADFDLPANFPPLALTHPHAHSPAVTPFTSPPLESEAASSPVPLSTPADEEEDFMDGLDFGAGEVLDPRKLTLNRNIVVKKTASKPATPPAARPTASITFTDKPSSGSRIPRPLPTSTARTRLTPVYESGAAMPVSTRPMPTTTSAQYLKAKRSAPMLRSSNFQPTPRSSAPFLPAGNSTAQSHHVTNRNSQPHLRRDSDPRRPLSPSMRSHSRMSLTGQMDLQTPNRATSRRDQAPSALGRHPPPPKKLTKPSRKRNFGDGHELDLFDDLPTSVVKEKQYEKTPRNSASNKTLRSQNSTSRLPMPDRMTTPLPPQTPKSPPKTDNTPRFARDTASSRNAREQRLAGTRSRGEGPILPPTRPVSWQAQVAARSPHTSPTALRKKGTGSKPQLIRQMTQPFTQTEKGMVYNPSMQRWEGNEDVLVSFSQPNNSTTTLALTTASTPTFAPPGMSHGRAHDRSQSMSHNLLSSIHSRNLSAPRLMKVPSNPAPAPSPPRPALISQISAPRGVQYDGRMVFDPVKMTWLKAPRHSTGPQSPMSVGEGDEEEDPFAGLDDLKDNESVVGGNNYGGGAGGATNADDPTFVGEEFDVGPSFIRRQREEEAVWRRKVEGWVGGIRDSGEARGGWRWAIREFASNASAGAFEN
ncbi:hypothetical protein C7974DRAFT_385600 [Boeremia exigua]|uniref:uncharacterized protein n=1 Tax=Boeremia exigua TaxID=749465 RepID=UPI001E8E2A29|nr:uncharacterized protein C7974DRAFT_385600 [Boeremia exigua]KAH6642527.1 hypothetical protein C7974DRAFT_385600 [Boeremia exigua]